MKLVKLFERSLSVHVNGPLTVIADLIERDFSSNISSIPFSNRCLMAQCTMILAKRTGLSERELYSILNKQMRAKQLEFPKGVTPQDVVDIYDGKVFKVEGVKYELKLSFYTYHSLAEVIRAVKTGDPVIVPYEAWSLFGVGILHQQSGTYVYPNRRHSYAAAQREPGSSYHSLLVVGVDDEERTLILRDIRPAYLHKGYVKVPFGVFKAHIKICFTFDADLQQAK